MKALREVIDALNRDGFEVKVGRTKRHWALRIERGGKRGRVIVAVTPSDHRYVENVVRDARKAVR